MSEQDTATPKKKKTGKGLKRVAIAVLASLAGVSVTEVAAAVVAYDAIFPRYERPDYKVTAGLYDYSRVADTLPREVMRFPSRDAELCGYYYPVEHPIGLVVVAHGFHAGADEYLPIIEVMVGAGYSVFTYDVTGTYDSGGDSVIGMCQSLVDLDYALNFVKNDPIGRDLPFFLIGHSWGGYAASSVMALHPDVRGCALIAPMYNGATMMVEKGEQYVGKLAYMSKPVFDVYQRMLFGDYTKYDGVQGINATAAHVLIAQGIDDTVITMDGQSITAHRDEIKNPNVTCYFGRGSQGSHTGIWHSDAAEEYARKLQSDIKRFEIENGRKMTYEEQVAFWRTVDHRLYSEVNGELMALILATFEKGLQA